MTHFEKRRLSDELASDDLTHETLQKVSFLPFGISGPQAISSDWQCLFKPFGGFCLVAPLLTPA